MPKFVDDLPGGYPESCQAERVGLEFDEPDRRQTIAPFVRHDKRLDSDVVFGTTARGELAYDFRLKEAA